MNESVKGANHSLVCAAQTINILQHWALWNEANLQACFRDGGGGGGSWFKLMLSHSHSPSPNVQSPNVSGSLPAWEPAVTCVFMEEMIAVTACPDLTALAQFHCATVRCSSGEMGGINK